MRLLNIGVIVNNYSRSTDPDGRIVRVYCLMSELFVTKFMFLTKNKLLLWNYHFRSNN